MPDHPSSSIGTRLYGVQLADKTRSRPAARALLSFAVRDTWGWEQLPNLGYGALGKPFFSDYPNLSFNLSHTVGLCLCALSDAGPVGVDIERVRPRRAGLPRYVMQDKEFAAFDGSWTQFYEIWTQKEAYCKYLGGAIFPPKAMPAPPPVPYRTYIGNGWRATLCGMEPLPAEILWLDEGTLPGAY